MKNALLIIAQNGFQDHELDGTRAGLLEAGFTVTLASTKVGECTGKFGGTEHALIALKDIDGSMYDRIGYIGGPGAHALRDDADAKRIAVDTVNAGKPLGAICIAPTILAAAGVLNGRNATVWNQDGEQSGYIEQHGARYTGESVTTDGLIITADGPQSAVEFGKAFASL
jgi:protease I